LFLRSARVTLRETCVLGKVFFVVLSCVGEPWRHFDGCELNKRVCIFGGTWGFRLECLVGKYSRGYTASCSVKAEGFLLWECRWQRHEADRSPPVMPKLRLYGVMFPLYCDCLILADRSPRLCLSLPTPFWLWKYYRFYSTNIVCITYEYKFLKLCMQ
jgi:hypothetical protein